MGPSPEPVPKAFSQLDIENKLKLNCPSEPPSPVAESVKNAVNAALQTW